MGDHVKAILKLKEKGSIVFDYGNNIRAQALKAGIKMHLIILVLFPHTLGLAREGKGPFRWVALSGDPQRYIQNG